MLADVELAKTQNVVPTVVLQPKTLIDCVVLIVQRMGDVEVNEVPSVDEAR